MNADALHKSRSLEVDKPDDFSLRKFARFHHTYDDHPLLQLDRLEQLAMKLVATEQCRFIAPGTKASSTFSHVKESVDGRSLADVFRQIETPGSWIALYDVETDAEYRDFLRDVVMNSAQVKASRETVTDVRGFIFISAPPSVTPFHIDRENNFWMQVRGRKTLTIWDREDRGTVPGKAVEDFIIWGSLDEVKLTDAALARGIAVDCGPGDGMYFPSTTPHMTSTHTGWVQPGDGVSISIGINFYTDATRRAAYVHSANRILRRLGLQPVGPDISAWRDAWKYALGRVVVAAMRSFRGYSPPPGF